ncbi:MAG TPA: PKD domain-containing protein [Candidatus Binatia bacterium]|nr:PKD domain-containing protein [Candidatus Binatia bacterium]
MNRTSLHTRFSLAAPLALMAALLVTAPAWAQYMYLDTNGDGVHTGADVVNPVGSTQVDVWLDTNHDRDGSLQTCNSHTGAPVDYVGPPANPGLDIFSYDIYLVVTHGTVSWGGFEDTIGFKVLPNDEFNTRTDTQIHISRASELGGEKPAGRYKLGSLTVSCSAGTPSIFFSPMVGWDFSSFGTHCSASEEFPNTYVYGVDWFDADGALYGGTINHEPVLAQPDRMVAVENHEADQALTATDEDGQALTFSKLSGPSYVTVTTTDPGTGTGSGSIHVAPSSADLGGASVGIRASDGIFWSDRTLIVFVQPELDLNAQPDVTVTAGQVAYQPLSASNPLHENVQYYIASGPSFVSLDSPVYGIRTRISPTPADLGTWTVTLGVVSGTARSEKTFTINVLRNGANHPPTVAVAGPAQGYVGRTVILDASHTTDPDGDALTFAWDLGDGVRATGPRVDHRYQTPGDYSVELTVFDPDVSVTATMNAHIDPVAPARAFVSGGVSAILGGASTVSVRVQSVGGSFAGEEISAANAASFVLSSAAGQAAAVGCDPSGDPDADRDGAPDQGILFTASDVASLLGSYAGRREVALTIQGDLVGGGRFSAPLTMQVIRHGGPLSAGISPNPLNPVGQLSFVTNSPGTADVKIFDVSGRLAHHPIDHGILPAGFHEVSVGHGSAGEALPSGIYYYRIETREGVARGRFAVVR